MSATRADVAARLQELVGHLQAAEEEACQAGIELAVTKADLEGAEAARTLGGLEGRNAEERKAFLFLFTQEHRDAHQAAQGRQQGAAMRLRVLHAEASILKAVSRLCAPEEDDA